MNAIDISKEQDRILTLSYKYKKPILAFFRATKLPNNFFTICGNFSARSRNYLKHKEAPFTFFYRVVFSNMVYKYLYDGLSEEYPFKIENILVDNDGNIL